MTAEATARVIQDMAAFEEDKRRLIGGLHGRVLEIGAGTGANLDLLAPSVDWLALEPDGRSRRRLARTGGRGTVLNATAERIPLANASVDAVLSTLVMCSVRDQERALDEIARVLRPGGRFVFFEHVAAPEGTWTRRLQQVFSPFSRLLDRGCDPSRETWRALERAPFCELVIKWYALGRWPHIGGYGVA